MAVLTLSNLQGLLTCLHDLHLQHYALMDIKSDNFLFFNGKIVFSDLTFSKVGEDKAAFTMMYSLPEMSIVSPSVHNKSSMYGLGLSIWELVTGECFYHFLLKSHDPCQIVYALGERLEPEFVSEEAQAIAAYMKSPEQEYTGPPIKVRDDFLRVFGLDSFEEIDVHEFAQPLVRIILKWLKLDPQDRPSYEEAIADIKQFQDSLDSSEV